MGRRLLTNWAQIAGLWTLALCLPLLQVLDDSPDYLIAEHSGFPDIPLVVLALVLVPPTIGIALEAIVYPGGATGSTSLPSPASLRCTPSSS